MFMDPDAAMLEIGGTVELTLTFETAGDVTVEAEVRAG
jgi:copper(I)-binding protein